jgi:hypothetical protein
MIQAVNEDRFGMNSGPSSFSFPNKSCYRPYAISYMLFSVAHDTAQAKVDARATPLSLTLTRRTKTTIKP